MTRQLVVFFQGICVAASWAIALVFFGFWREHRDRLFAYFAMGFGLLGVSWALLGVTNPSDDGRPYIYGLRLVVFLLIIIAMIDKNRSKR
jgi:MFS family permease